VGIQWEGITWGLAAAIWLLLALVPRLVSLRLPPPPGPATVDPGPEPPAVASLLVSGSRARYTAVAATVLDLGARGNLDLAWVGPSMLSCRAARPSTRTRVLPFEARVLERLRTHLRGDEAPVSALLPAPRSFDSRRWYRGFVREVAMVARDEGLVVPQLTPGLSRLLLLAAVVPAGLPALFLWRSGGWGMAGGVAAALVAAVVLLLAWVLLPRGVRATAAGRDAASRWLGVVDGLDAEPWQEQAPLRDPVPARILAVGADPDLMAAFQARRPQTFVGQVALRFQRIEGDGVSWYLAVEGGGGPRTRGWAVGHDLFDRFPTGSRVRATIDGRGRLLWLVAAS
jgi:hypothetical protein